SRQPPARRSARRSRRSKILNLIISESFIPSRASWCHSCSLCASIGFVVRHSRGNGNSVFLSLDSRFRGSDERFRPKRRLRQFIPPLSQHPLAQFLTRPRHRWKRIQPLIGPRRVDYGARIKTLLITGNDGIERTTPTAAEDLDIFHGIGPRA